MMRITKLTDYAVVILVVMANEPLRLFQAKELAARTDIKTPTVSKLLKNLAKQNLLHSSQGRAGGYRLKRSPEEISIMDLIEAIEGPFAITECNLGHDHCHTENHCTLRTPWQHINQVISDKLSSISLATLTNFTADNKTPLNDNFQSKINFESKFENKSGLNKDSKIRLTVKQAVKQGVLHG